MNKTLKTIFKYLILFIIGGCGYYGLECLWRGWSDWTMVVTSGVCYLIIGGINEFFTYEMPLWKQCLIGSIVITTLEFIVGCIVNLWLGWNVWHYEYLDILGQICLPFSLLWFVISGIVIITDDWFRYWWFGEEKPRYKLK